MAAPSELRSQERSAASVLRTARSLTIGNGLISAVILPPDPDRGFYVGTRFDWSGMIASLRLRDIEYYGPWFDGLAPDVSNFELRDGRIVVGGNSRALGPAETFDPDRPPGWDAAGAGGSFLKIGVGILRRPDAARRYSQFDDYPIVNGGRWSVRAGRRRASFVHRVDDRPSGYGYVYRKTISLLPGQPVMVVSHTLRNTGRRPIDTTVYSHNFLTLAAPQRNAGVTVTFPFAVSPVRPPRSDAITIGDRTLRYQRGLREGETAAVDLTGFGASAADYDLLVRDARGAGYRVKADRPMSRLSLWSISSNVSVEPYLSFAVAPSRQVEWTYTYTYLTGGGR